MIQRLLASNLEYYITTFFILQAFFEIIFKNIIFIFHGIDRQARVWYNIIISWPQIAAILHGGEDMPSKIPDDFWDISALIPKKKITPPPSKKSVEAVDVTVSAANRGENREYSQDDTVIHRVITPTRSSSSENDFESCERYEPAESLLHAVTLKKWKCSYHFYDEFLQDAIRYHDTVGTEAPYVGFFSYVPQYNQLSADQLSYYLWWRECCRRGEFIKTEHSYLLLYIFELINLGTRVDVRQSQRMLVELWKHYHEVCPAIIGNLLRWICDFSLIHRLPPPENADATFLRNEAVLKEFYIAMPSDDMRACARSLLQYCTSYDYRTSKFAKGENLALYREHVLGALTYVLQAFKGEAGLLQKFSGGDSHMTRNAFEGALCCSAQKYCIEIDYCSFSRTNELRYLIGDVVKYAENKIRAHIGVKSRLSVYSVTQELRAVIDEYFSFALKPRSAHVKKEEKHAYDVLYELPKKQFSLADAKRIEQESWQTTHDLVSAFEENADIIAMEEEHNDSHEAPLDDENKEALLDLGVALGPWLSFARAVLAGDRDAQQREAAHHGKMCDWIVDEINAIASDVIGDILIDGDGEEYTVIEDYREML